jgi:hypothetical protein
VPPSNVPGDTIRAIEILHHLTWPSCAREGFFCMVCRQTLVDQRRDGLWSSTSVITNMAPKSRPVELQPRERRLPAVSDGFPVVVTESGCIRAWTSLSPSAIFTPSSRASRKSDRSSVYRTIAGDHLLGMSQASKLAPCRLRRLSLDFVGGSLNSSHTCADHA